MNRLKTEIAREVIACNAKPIYTATRKNMKPTLKVGFR